MTIHAEIDDATDAPATAPQLAAGNDAQAQPQPWNDPWPGVSESALTAALRGCWVTVVPEADGSPSAGHMAHPDRVASACLRWIASPGNPDRPEMPDRDTAPPTVLPAMNIDRLTEIIATVTEGRTLPSRERVIRLALDFAADEAAAEERITRQLDGTGRESRGRILAALNARYAPAATATSTEERNHQ